MPPIGVEAKVGNLAETIALYNGARARWEERIKRTGTRFGEAAVVYIQRRYRTGGTTETRTGVRTGRLRRSYGFLVNAFAVGVSILVGVVRPEDESVLEYAALQEYGGTIRPKNARALTIPLDAAKTSAGVPRGRARDFEDTFILRRDDDVPLIAQRRGREKIVPLFALVQEVTVDARPSLEPTAEALLPKLENQLLEDLRMVIHGELAA